MHGQEEGDACEVGKCTADKRGCAEKKGEGGCMGDKNRSSDKGVMLYDDGNNI